jgi:hypothetical protein
MECSGPLAVNVAIVTGTSVGFWNGDTLGEL